MRRLTSATAIVTVVVVLVAIGTPLLGMTVFAGTDIMLTHPPWSYLVPTDFVAQNRFVGDPVDGFLPATDVFRERLAAGDFAEWWSYSSGGAQLGSVPSYAFLSPLSLPYLLLPLELAPGYAKLLELVVAIGGSYLFLRRLDLMRASALLGGLVFAFSGFMIAWTNWPHTRVAACIPALFWAVERLVQRRRLGDVALIAGVVAAMVLGGFPAVMFLGLVSAGVYCVVRVLVPARPVPSDPIGQPSDRPSVLGGGAGRTRRALAVIGLATAGVLVGVGVAAAQLLPFVQELQTVATGARTQTPDSHSPVESLVLTFTPNAYGTADVRTGNEFWYGLGHPVEEMSYLGAGAMVLALFAVVARRRPGLPRGVRSYFAVAMLVTGVLIYLGGPLLALLQQLPVFSTNRIGRARSVLGFFVGVLAAVGFDALVRAPAQQVWSSVRRWLWRGWAVTVWAAALVAGGAVVFLGRRQAFAYERSRYFHESLLLAAIFAALAVGLVLLARHGRGVGQRVALLGVPVLVGLQALTVVVPFWPRVASEHFYPETATHEFLAANVGGDRIVAAEAMLTGTEAYYDLRTVGGRGFVAENYDDLLREGCPSCFVTPTYVAPPGDLRAFDNDVLDRLAAKYRVADPAAPIPGNAEALGGLDGSVELEPGESVEVALPPGGLRAVGLALAELHETRDPYARLEVVLRDRDGEVVVSTQRRLMDTAVGGPVLAAVPEPAAADAVTATVTLVDDEPMLVRGEGGVAAVVLVRPVDDGLRVVSAGGATVYERSTAWPRVRWAASAVVEPDEQTALELVSSGDAPDVVLSTPGPSPSGEPAGVAIVEDSGDVVEVDVDAEGAGYLVVADALQDRWAATVDGAPAELRAADVGVVAVAVPAGEHVVRLAYDRPAGPTGYVISGASLAVILGLALLDRRRATHARRNDHVY